MPPHFAYAAGNRLVPGIEAEAWSNVFRLFKNADCLKHYIAESINTSCMSVSIPDFLFTPVCTDEGNFYRFSYLLATDFWETLRALARFVICAAANFSPLNHRSDEFPTSYSARAEEELQSSGALQKIPHLDLAFGDENPLLKLRFPTLDRAQLAGMKVQRLWLRYMDYICEVIERSLGQGDLSILNWGARWGLNRFQFLRQVAPSMARNLQRLRARRHTANVAAGAHHSQLSHRARVLLSRPSRVVHFVAERYHPRSPAFQSSYITLAPTPALILASQVSFIREIADLGVMVA